MSWSTGSVASRTTVHFVRNLTHSTYVLRFDRNGLDFEPGQYISVGVKGEIDMREYSIYSSPFDDYLEILVREVEDGYLSTRLRYLERGDELEVEGPFGFFTIDPYIRANGNLLFVATGSGISPFHSIVRSYPKLNYRLLHGVRTVRELYDHETFCPDRVVSCISREAVKPSLHRAVECTGDGGGFYQGRVTDYLQLRPPSADTHCYACGNCDMIYESFDILREHGVPPEQLFAEVYF